MNIHDIEALTPIIEKCISGSRKAQNELYSVAFPYAMNIALRYASDKESGLDIVNESFFKAFNYLKNYDPSHSFGAWLRRIVINTAIDHYHKKQKAVTLITYSEDYGMDEFEIDQIQKDMNAEEILFYIQQLPPAYRIVLSLFAIEGYSHKEIADKLNISEGTSKSNYHKAKAHLKKMLQLKGEMKKLGAK